MKNALHELESVLNRAFSPAPMMLLDFDGTLSPIVPVPDDASASESTKAVVRACAERMPVAIVSGRSLDDIARRVGVDNVWYAGSHGLEWMIDGKRHQVPSPEKSVFGVRLARELLTGLSRTYPQLILEDKGHTMASNYRFLSPDEQTSYRKEVHEALAHSIQGGAVKIMDDMCTLEVAPAIDWTKGECCATLLDLASERAGKALVPIYIGDAVTDEDAFRAMSAGITVRVEANEHSAAEFYVPARDDVDTFISAVTQRAKDVSTSTTQ